MNKVNYALLCLFLLVFSDVHAMDPQGYYFLLEKSKTGNNNAEMLLEGYFNGVSESLMSLHALNRGKIHVGGGSFACPPSADILTPELAITSLQQIIGTAYKPKEIEDGLYKSPVAGLVILGLGKLFPCN